MKRPTRFVVVCSEGGHWVQASRIIQNLDQLPVLIVIASRNDVPSHFNCDGCAVEVRRTVDFNARTVHRLPVGFFHVFNMFREVRPTHVITTGAAPGLIALIVGRIFGARTLWIDSIANSRVLSLSGRLSRIFSDETWSQWEEVADRYGCGYKGRLL